jgi:hypothetical protein
MRRSRRLEILQDQLHRANRRAAGPFSHPFANRGLLSKLREQIRDVSRVTDAVLLNAESANDQRLDDLCSDVRSLLQTQQRWTDRLENQIWRLESQASLMRRLQQLLLDRSPANDRLWELCEAIARDTQALPSGLLLLPEPGQCVLLTRDHVSSRAAWSLEQARLAVYSAVTLLPDVRGADIVAQTLQASSLQLLELVGRDHEASVFAEPLWMQRSAIAGPPREVSRIINVAGQILAATETLSLTAADNIVPPAIEEFYAGLAFAFEAKIANDQDLKMARAICLALGLPVRNSGSNLADSQATDDAAIVLTHKLRWHDGASNEVAEKSPSARPRIRRPHFAAANSPTTSLTLFAREE